MIYTLIRHGICRSISSCLSVGFFALLAVAELSLSGSDEAIYAKNPGCDSTVHTNCPSTAYEQAPQLRTLFNFNQSLPIDGNT